MDPLDLAAVAVKGAVGSSEENHGYGIYETEREADRVVMRSRTCAMWDLARDNGDAGWPEDTFCGPHQLFYQELASRIDPSLSFRFAKALGRGHDCCEWVFVRHHS